MLSVPKKANDAIHLSHLEGLEEGLSKDALGDVLLQDKFQVWDSKQLIKKGKDRHVFLFETSLVVAKEVKDQRGKLKYLYKFKLMTSEINITEHMEGDSCKFAVWTGRAPLLGPPGHHEEPQSGRQATVGEENPRAHPREVLLHGSGHVRDRSPVESQFQGLYGNGQRFPLCSSSSIVLSFKWHPERRTFGEFLQRRIQRQQWHKGW